MAASPDRQAVAEVLDAFHEAAGAADEERYLATLAEDMVFLGTDPGERWAGPEFREFVHSYFPRGIGWLYTPSGRTIEVAPDGATAWFDERLESEHFGECRGSGVLRNEDGGWRIVQYNLSIPVPNELTKQVVALIRDR